MISFKFSCLSLFLKTFKEGEQAVDGLSLFSILLDDFSHAVAHLKQVSPF